jgi:ribosomal protein S18 acetylase RimI-like enzyme
MSGIRYFKRYRMEMLITDLPSVPPLPAGYAWLGWDDALIETHAEVKYACFHTEIDALVFPSLGDRCGCLHLMRAIRHKPGFHPPSTWLVEGPAGLCGTVQGLRDRGGFGAIQNLGVVPSQRGRGLGSALLVKALHGFAAAGLYRAYLEVTADNDAAVRLYRRLGFRCRKTVYKAVESAAVYLTLD